MAYSLLLPKTNKVNAWVHAKAPLSDFFYSIAIILIQLFTVKHNG